MESSALKDLRTRIFAHKGDLLLAFKKHDPDETGTPLAFLKIGSIY